MAAQSLRKNSPVLYLQAPGKNGNDPFDTNRKSAAIKVDRHKAVKEANVKDNPAGKKLDLSAVEKQ